MRNSTAVGWDGHQKLSAPVHGPRRQWPSRADSFGQLWTIAAVAGPLPLEIFSTKMALSSDDLSYTKSCDASDSYQSGYLRPSIVAVMADRDHCYVPFVANSFYRWTGLERDDGQQTLLYRSNDVCHVTMLQECLWHGRSLWHGRRAESTPTIEACFLNERRSSVLILLLSNTGRGSFTSALKDPANSISKHCSTHECT